VEIDFVSHCVVIMDADAPPPDAHWIRVQGRLRFGAMMVAPGELQGVRVHVLLDTGSDVSLCNTAFRNAISRVRASVVEYHGNRAFTAGRPVVLENAIWTPRLHVGTASMSNITSYVGDYHIFDLWGLHDEPTILIGMDVIASSGAIVIDYASNTIYFRRRPSRPW
ncbi:MAG: aspartyl protease family protein, partial [Pseudomonadota bacterium]